MLSNWESMYFFKKVPHKKFAKTLFASHSLTLNRSSLLWADLSRDRIAFETMPNDHVPDRLTEKHNDLWLKWELSFQKGVFNERKLK